MSNCELCGTRMDDETCPTCGWRAPAPDTSTPEVPSVVVAPPPPRPVTTGSGVSKGLVAVVAAVAVVGVFVVWLTQSRDSGATVYGSSSSQTVGADSSLPGGGTATDVAGYPDVRVAKGKHCRTFDDGPYGQVGTANSTTSCPFAINVREAYVDAGVDGADAIIHAYSPVTKKDYEMTCSGTQPALCTGGVAARVIIFGGTLIIEGS